MRCVSSFVLAGIVTAMPAPVARAQVCESTELIGSDLGSGDQLGFSSAGWGDVVAVGAPFDDERGGNAGAAYVFRFDGATWTEQARLTAPDGAAADFLGAAVAVGDNVILVGAPFDDDAGPSTGAVYVYRFNGAGWSLEAKLTADDADGQEEFGTAVAIHGDTAIVGAHREDRPAAGNAGAAYVFVREGAAWTQQAKLVADDVFADDGFGRAVAIDGPVAVIGAPFDDTGGSSSGSAYVFRRSGGAWQQEEKLIDADGDFNDLLGRGVAIRGDVVAAGAPGDNTPAAGGSVSIFRRRSGAWSRETVIPAPVGAGNFGIAVSLQVGELLVGSPGTDTNPAPGSARFYTFDGLDWVPGATLIASNGQVNDAFGSSAQLAETFAVIGAPNLDGAFSGSGGAFVHAELEMTDCNGNGVDDTCDIATLDSSDDNGDHIPDECQPVAGDTNGDGVTDASDLDPIITNFGACPPEPRACPGDADGNGAVDIDDIIFVILNWTTGPIMDGGGR
jgi:hypothetical protein